jgi:8-oxo-dGTP diphosphatase
MSVKLDATHPAHAMSLGAMDEDHVRAGVRQEPGRPELSVGAVAVRDGAILLIQRGQPPSLGLWSLPGGRVEWGETMVEALRREMEEETGLQAEVGRLAGVVERIYPEEGFHYIILDYFVTIVSGTLRPGGDVTGARWTPLEGLDRLPLAPGLIEALRDFGVPID